VEIVDLNLFFQISKKMQESYEILEEEEISQGQQWRCISSSRTLANLGKKTPYIAPQKTNRYRFFGHPEAAQSSPEQSQEWLRPVLRSEYPTTAQPGAARSNSGFHSGFAKQQNHSYEKRDIFCIRNPFLANLGFLKSL
jgi:hypothetical protein